MIYSHYEVDMQKEAETRHEQGAFSGFPSALQTCVYVLSNLVAQMVKWLSAIRETWVQSLGWEDPLEKEMEIHLYPQVFLP